MKLAVQCEDVDDDDDDDDNNMGPMKLPQSNAAGGSQGGGGGGKVFDKAILLGEGQAIAQYVQQNLRIPRHGEIGYTGDEIEQYEKSGHVWVATCPHECGAHLQGESSVFGRRAARTSTFHHGRESAKGIATAGRLL